jgi:hypothetical protein
MKLWCAINYWLSQSIERKRNFVIKIKTREKNNEIEITSIQWDVRKNLRKYCKRIKNRIKFKLTIRDIISTCPKYGRKVRSNWIVKIKKWKINERNIKIWKIE